MSDYYVNTSRRIVDIKTVVVDEKDVDITLMIESIKQNGLVYFSKKPVGKHKVQLKISAYSQLVVWQGPTI